MLAGLVWLKLTWTFSSGRVRAALLAVNLALACALARDAGPHRAIRLPDRPTLRIVQWTLDAKSTNAALIGEFARELPHVLLLHHPPEALMMAGQTDAARRMRLHFALRRMAILMVSRFPMEPLTPPIIPEIETMFVRVNDPAGAFYLLALDAKGTVMTSHHIRPILDFLRENADARPLILSCGNARERTDAVWQPVRKMLNPAYERAGFGWPYSAPAWFPLYARDHLWLSHDFEAHGAGYRWSRHSSHLRQFAILSRPNDP